MNFKLHRVPAVLALVLAAECNAQITLDGTLGPRQALTGPNIVIDSAKGQVRGTNLFHSFGRFNVQHGESATFTNSLPAPISNVLSRVTGGERSFIDGRVRSTIAGANLYLINPAGVMFGPSAVLDVSGAFHVTTADYLRLADGGVFHARLDQGSVLTVAAPVAFGFLGAAPAPISFDGTTLQVPPGSTLSVIAGDTTLAGATLRAASGRINLASVASAGEVVPSAPGAPPDLDVSSFSRMGRIQHSEGGNVTVSSDAGAGTALIRGGRLIVEGEASFNANTTGAGLGAPLGIDIRVTADIVFDNGAILSQSSGSGRAGNAWITAGKLELKNGGFIQLSTFGMADGGDLALNVRSLHLSEGGAILIGTGGPARGGDVSLDANSISLSGSSDPARLTGIFASTSGSGGSGALNVTSQRLEMTGNTTISNASFSFGPAGTLKVDVDGDITITGSGNPAVFTGLFANTFGRGQGGTLQVVSKTLRLADRATIQAASFAQGDAGSATVHTGHLEISGGSSIFSSALFGFGNAGVVDVQADTIVIRGVRDSIDPFGVIDFTGFSTTAGVNAKRGGDIRLTARSILLTDKGAIASVSLGSGDAGTILIAADELVVNERSQINSSTAASGRGGNIQIRANNVIVSGAGAALGPLDPDVSGIAAQTLGGSGAAGDISIAAGHVQALDGAKISTQTLGSGRGGNIDLSAGRVTLAGGALISADSSASASAGNAGAIAINASESVRIAASSVTTAAETAAGGAIAIAGAQVELSDGATISAKSSGGGNAGNVAIKAGDTLLMRNSTVSTEATRADGGNIELIAPTMVRLIDSTVTTSVGTGEGKGGNIVIDPEFVILDRSEIRADAFGGPGGSIGISADVFLTQESVLSASSTLSTPGTIDIQARFTDVSGNVVRLPESVPVAAAILRASCAARLAGGSASSLVVAGREGLPPDPEGMLPSPLLMEHAPARAHPAEAPVRRMAAPPGLFSLLAADRLCSGFGLR